MRQQALISGAAGKRTVEHAVTLLPSEQTFQVQAGELILDAAIRQGVKVPFSCRNGTCRSCMHEIKEGLVEAVDVADCVISEQELAMNRRLLCMSLCHSNAVLEKTLPRKR